MIGVEGLAKKKEAEGLKLDGGEALRGSENISSMVIRMISLSLWN